MPDEPDDLDELLAPPPVGPSPELRRVILQRTQRRLTLAKWQRRLGRCAALAAVFVAGIGVGVWRSPPAREVLVVLEPALQVEVVPVPITIPVPAAPTESVPAPRQTARALELDAEQADGLRSAGLYRLAGDAYLSAEADHANAARCYRLFLALGGENALAPKPDDSWLLTAIKGATLQEKTNATRTDD
jgi:hypothetical protein